MRLIMIICALVAMILGPVFGSHAAAHPGGHADIHCQDAASPDDTAHPASASIDNDDAADGLCAVASCVASGVMPPVGPAVFARVTACGVRSLDSAASGLSVKPPLDPPRSSF
jgi:hypothetical protein